MSFSEMDSQLHGGIEAEKEVIEMAQAVATVERLSERFTDSQITRLSQAIRFRVESDLPAPEQDNEYGAGFSLAQEINMQLKAVRALRSSVMYDSGRPKEDVDPRDLKDAITAANSMIGTLMKQHEKVMSMERNRAVESATVEALQELKEEHGMDAVETYLSILERKLETIE
ncbi:hypothetical protein [Endozoicomonas sp. ALC066]|uniref:hypothetical protein n=1 Tax=Endozoicomonas sp. ALC066 TaxID=3403078 RepID=UPI003BB797CA